MPLLPVIRLVRGSISDNRFTRHLVGATMAAGDGGDGLRFCRVEVLGRYVHPGRGFTQGLIVGDGTTREIAFCESTGLYW